MLNRFDKITKFILTVLVWELLIIAGACAIWWISEKHNANNFSDILFMISCVVFCIGALIVITSTSRRHYYKYLRKKRKGIEENEIEKNEEDYENDIKNRKRYTQYGSGLGCAGLIGMIISGVILYF